MKTITTLCFALLLLSSFLSNKAAACSTFKLQKGDSLVYGHNLNEGDLGVPGMVFINKRGIFKIGRTWSELTTSNKENPSDYSWVSRYGSVTFNCFGRDFPDGGMNEAGLYIWEMNENADYPKNDSLPKLDQMQWMQFILDNYSTTEEAIKCASKIEISGWGWHFFIGDAQGNTAALAFIDGKVVTYTNNEMPVPALFNTPYKRELEFLKYYKNYGGLYEPDLNDPNVPRFVKTDVLIKNYKTSESVVEYGMMMLDQIKVNDVPEWSILFDVKQMKVHFKTRLNPELKSFSMNEIDFSNHTPTQIMNMDYTKRGDVKEVFETFTNSKMKDFLTKYVVPILPEAFFTSGSISTEDWVNNFSSHTNKAALKAEQILQGTWRFVPEQEDETPLSIIFLTKSEAVICQVSNSDNTYPANHFRLLGNKLEFTFRTKSNQLLEAKASLSENQIQLNLYAIENDLGSYTFLKD